MTQTYRPAEIPATELEAKPLALPSARPISGEIITRSKVEFINDERTVISGTWESDLGTSRWEFLTRAEIVHILEGAMTVQRDGEEAVELTTGSVAYFPLGWTGVWTVTRPVRKFYVVYK
ncbi:cupin domain-containing protein [Microbacterium halotolerans]|uniref:cupin domain-containing protein n=1 Tax=Microbacterium halotolerans TaxID=246613 RepID=UPI000E6ADF02|nr:cupin domain-containing protein [Microbacterium halotolerans]